MTQSNSSGTDRIIALISTYNEGDLIYHVIGDLIENGLEVYLLDNNSADNTIEEASKWLGKGLIKVERFPEEAGPEYSARCNKEYVWKEILRRKEELATQLGATWYIHADADEFRESPWPGMTLAEGIRKVDRLGYSAINFELLNFRPTDDLFQPGTDVRKHLVSYEPGEIFDAMQIKAWKNPKVRVEIARNGGHSINFPGRKIFPINFILRHYPIRGETHGRRKVYKDRLPRFAAEEVAHNWHIQYNEYIHGKAEFLFKQEQLVRYEANDVRAKILARFSDDLILASSVSGVASIVGPPNLKALTEWATNHLKTPQPLPAEQVIMAEKVLMKLLPAQEKGVVDVEATMTPLFTRLLLAMLEVKISLARLSGNSHLAYLCMRLQVSLKKKLI